MSIRTRSVIVLSLVLALLALAVATGQARASAAKPASLSSLYVQGLPMIGGRVDDFGQCFGEDDQALVYMVGDLAPGASAPLGVFRFCEQVTVNGVTFPVSGGNIGVRVYATAYGKQPPPLVASITRADGVVLTHGDPLVCFDGEEWHYDPNVNGGNPYSVGDGQLERGTFVLDVKNASPKTLKNVTITYEIRVGWLLEGSCPEGDIIFNGE